MGIRVDKDLCYGLVDVKSNDYNIIDDRFNDKTDVDNPWYLNIEEFIAWYKTEINKDRESELFKAGCEFMNTDPNNEHILWWPYFSLTHAICQKENNKSCDAFCDPIIFDPEYGLSNVFGVADICHKSWRRHDDIIDYYELGRGADCEPTVIDLFEKGSCCGIYPNEHYMYLKHGEEPLSDYSQNILGGEFNKDTGRWDSVISPMVDDDTVKNLLNKYRCDMPFSIFMVCYFMNIFKDPIKTCAEFRPLIYTHWG